MLRPSVTLQPMSEHLFWSRKPPESALPSREHSSHRTKYFALLASERLDWEGCITFVG